MIALALALAFVSLVLVAGSGLLGWTVFTAIRRDIAAMLASLTKAQDAGTRLLEELVQAERELRPVVRDMQTAVPVAARSPLQNMPETERPSTTGLAPMPGWLSDVAERVRQAQMPTDAAVPTRTDWDVDDRLPGDGTPQAVTFAERSNYNAPPPG